MLLAPLKARKSLDRSEIMALLSPEERIKVALELLRGSEESREPRSNDVTLDGKRVDRHASAPPLEAPPAVPVALQGAPPPPWFEGRTSERLYEFLREGSWVSLDELARLTYGTNNTVNRRRVCNSIIYINRRAERAGLEMAVEHRGPRGLRCYRTIARPLLASTSPPNGITGSRGDMELERWRKFLSEERLLSEVAFQIGPGTPIVEGYEKIRELRSRGLEIVRRPDPMNKEVYFYSIA